MALMRDYHEMAASFTDWWGLAGYRTAVGDIPADWFAGPAHPPAPPPPIAAPGTAPPAPADQPGVQPMVSPPARQSGPSPAPPPIPHWPSDRHAFRAWLADAAEVPHGAWHRTRLLPTGPCHAPLAVMALCPEAADHQAGALFAGPAGALLDAMLGAIGLVRGDVMLMTAAVTRPPGGQVAAETLPVLAALARTQINCAAPQRLLLLGTDLAQMLTAASGQKLPADLLFVNHDGGTTPAMAIPHPATLLGQPNRKAAAWHRLLRLKQELV